MVIAKWFGGNKIMRNWFENIDCVEVLKKQYFALAKKYHSDINGGDDEAMKEINGQYESLFKKWKDVHLSSKEDGPRTYNATKLCAEAPFDFINIVASLLKIDGIVVELCGRWLWISGDTKPHKDELGAIGCKWSPKKKMWSWHFPEEGTYWYKGKRETSIESIRTTYGSVVYSRDEERKLLAQ